MPPDFDDKLDLFDKMNVIKIFKPEKIMFGISNFVEKRIGLILNIFRQILFGNTYNKYARNL
jgi:hypothetical protein